MTPAKKILAKLGLEDPGPIGETSHPGSHETSENSRRFFLKKSAAGGIALGSAFMFSPIEEIIANTTQKVRRYSGPSDLKITDPARRQRTGRTSILRIDTNRGIYGLGEVRRSAIVQC
jgi:hypothetical protein